MFYIGLAWCTTTGSVSTLHPKARFVFVLSHDYSEELTFTMGARCDWDSNPCHRGYKPSELSTTRLSCYPSHCNCWQYLYDSVLSFSQPTAESPVDEIFAHGGTGPLLHYTEEVARTNNEISSLRRQKRGLEMALQELQLSSSSKQEQYEEQIGNPCQLYISNLICNSCTGP